MMYCIFVLAWASCVAYPCRWAMREPGFGISKSTDSHAFFVSCRFRGDYRRIGDVRMNKLIYSLLLLCVIAGCNNKDVLNGEIIPVESGSKYGYVDKEGKYLINPQFDRASFFWGGVAVVVSGELYGYIDTKGNYVVPPTYKDVTTFSEGVAWTVRKDGAPTAINKKGEILFVLKDADRVYNFSEGLARYRIISPCEDEGYLYGFINKNGEISIPPIYHNAEDFAEGLAAVANEEGEYGYINKAGELAMNCQFERADPFHKGRAVVCSNHVYGAIDKDGKYVINPQFGYMRRDEEDYAIRLQDGRQWGWCDEKGKIFINPQFDAIDSFDGNELAPVWINKKAGFIKHDGSIAVNPQFDEVSPFFDNSYAFVMVNRKLGAVDKEGKFIFNPQFDGLGELAKKSVLSDFFDQEAIMAVVRTLISSDKIDGKVDFTTSLSRIMSEYGLSEKDISRTKDSHKLREITPFKDASIVLSVEGNFYNKVSDGWWGYNYVLAENAIPAKYQIVVSLKNKGQGKVENITQGVFDHFKALASEVNEYARELGYGAFHLSFAQKGDKLLIICSKR